MRRYRLEVVRYGDRWCEIVIEGLHADETLEDIDARFPCADGYRIRAWKEEEEARVVEFGEHARTIGVRYRSVRLR